MAARLQGVAKLAVEAAAVGARMCAGAQTSRALPYLMIEGLFVLIAPLIPFVATKGAAYRIVVGSVIASRSLRRSRA